MGLVELVSLLQQFARGEHVSRVLITATAATITLFVFFAPSGYSSAAAWLSTALLASLLLGAMGWSMDSARKKAAAEAQTRKMAEALAVAEANAAKAVEEARALKAAAAAAAEKTRRASAEAQRRNRRRRREEAAAANEYYTADAAAGGGGSGNASVAAAPAAAALVNESALPWQRVTPSTRRELYRADERAAIKLRFSVGQRVMAKTDTGWLLCYIHETWYQQDDIKPLFAAYQLRVASCAEAGRPHCVDPGCGHRLIYARTDVDDSVRPERRGAAAGGEAVAAPAVAEFAEVQGTLVD